MGEYGSYNGSRVKLGTCESMYYLRADQRATITAADFDLFDPEILAAVRFRFPFPDEDDIEPGAFEDYDRGLRLDGVRVPEGVEHGNVQLTGRNGYLVLIPCPESGEHDAGPGAYASRVVTLPNGGTLGVALNGYGGSTRLVQQAWRGGRWVGVAECNGCGALYRLEDGYEAEAATAILNKADERIRDRDRWNQGNPDQEPITGDNGAGFYLTTADRLLAGYSNTEAGAA